MKNFSYILFFLSLNLSAQFLPEKGRVDVVTIGAGANFTSFIGDLGSKTDASPLANVAPIYYVNLERRFGNILGVQLNGGLGTLAYNERSSDIFKNRNFKSDILQVGANLVLHFDNDLIIKKESPFAPFLSGGFHYLTFDSYTDLKDENGLDYHYWSDGTINDVPETEKDEKESTILYRDYNFETQLTDSTVNYERNTFTIPISVGLKWKLTNRFNGRIFGTYSLLLTDWIDNVKSGGNDKNLSIGFGLHYALKVKDKEQRHLFDDVDFEELAVSDSDMDGVQDQLDKCQNTPKEIKVNGFGCPIDSDKDGIPDYLDKEKNTKKGAIVDENGVTLTAELLAERKEAKQQLITQRNTTFSEDASTATLDKIFEEIRKSNNYNGKIPAHLKEADINGDGLISPKEVSMTMDAFFDGMSTLSVAGLHELIDYFFEQ